MVSAFLILILDYKKTNYSMIKSAEVVVAEKVIDNKYSCSAIE